jgi:hypothetical protein
MITGYITLKALIAKLYRDLGLTTEINESHVIEWTSESLLMIGSYYQYSEIKECLDLKDGKVRLPDNFYRIIDIAYKNRPLHWASPSALTQYGCEESVIPVCCTENNFYINNNYIITDIKASNLYTSEPETIAITYLGIPVDDEGYPMIPDDVYFMKACAAYITYMMDQREWRKGNITDKVVQKSESDWLFYVNSARGSANMPSIAQLENLKNVWVRLIPKQNEYSQFFANNNKQEKRYRF